MMLAAAAAAPLWSTLLSVQKPFLKPVQAPTCLLEFSTSWQVLGPFQIGTREATWGADPLEFLGGFRSLKPDEYTTFPSSLAPNATVSWSTTQAQDSSCDALSARIDLSVTFPDIDLDSLQRIYGWAALQYQAWARGFFHINADRPQTLALSTDNLLEFYLDGVHHFGGDYYAFRRAPLVLHLEPGVHSIDLRLVRDVRAMGGIGVPTIDVQLEVQVSAKRLHLVADQTLMPDMVQGRLPSMLGSLQVRNDHVHDIDILSVSANDSSYFVWLLQPGDFRVVAGQTRPVSIAISCETDCSPYIGLDVEYETVGQHASQSSVLHLDHQFVKRSLHEPFKVTFYHPGGMVSYAILRPPQNVSCPLDSEGSLPILLQLHGAGVEADNDIVRHAFDPLPDLCAWALFPTGSTPWSGDDWHVWGFADVEAAIRAVPGWIENIGWTGPGVNTNRWLVSGHSNGGQGTWYASTHRPDNVFAAAPVSGYSSIQNYVPYDLWRPMPPAIRALLDMSLSSYRHELLLENLKNIRILQQHGSIDDNVPPFHSRLLSQLLKQAGSSSTYVELRGKNHWFDGIMTTEPLSRFYEQELNGGVDSVRAAPEAFTVVAANPADSGPKFGIEILHLRRPRQLGKIRVSFSSSTCFLRTSNVFGLRLPSVYPQTHDIVIDDQIIELSPQHEANEIWRGADGLWKVLPDKQSPVLRERRQLGGMDALFRTQDTLQIISHSPDTRHVALQISRNLCQYLGADTKIQSASQPSRQYSNMIHVVLASSLPTSYLKDFAIQADVSNGISIRTADGPRRFPGSAGLGAIFLRPLPAGALELVIWGYDADGLDIAARLVPMLPGVGQPEFVVADRRMLWEGAGGVLAMGSFDHLWNVTESSYLS